MSLSISYSFSPTTIIQSSQVNQNFTDIVNYLNNTACVTGMIVMWGGSIASIPTGWVLANGGSGSPDLRDKFIVGAGNTYSVGATGGEATHTLTINEMPSHTHTQNAHTHTQDAHAHTISGKGSTVNVPSGTFTSAIVAAGSITTDNTTATNQYTTATNQNTGGGTAHENRPPYYGLAFLYKT